MDNTRCTDLGLEYGLLDRAGGALPETFAILDAAFSGFAREQAARLGRAARVAVYGASESGRAAAALLRGKPQIALAGFVDGYSLSDDFERLPCLPPDRLPELGSLDAVLVAVAPRHLGEIRALLGKHAPGVAVWSMYRPQEQAAPLAPAHADAQERFAVHEHSRRLREYLRQEREKLPPVNERPVELAFIFNQLARLYPKTLLDVGAGGTTLPNLLQHCGFEVTAVDLDPLANRHFYLEQADIVTDDLGRSFDVITCISTLEHIPDHAAAMANMFRHLRPGGALLLTVPYHEERYVPNSHALPGTTRPSAMGVTQIFSRRELDGWIAASGWELAGEEFYAHYTGELFTLGEEFYPARRVLPGQGKADLACLALRRPA